MNELTECIDIQYTVSNALHFAILKGYRYSIGLYMAHHRFPPLQSWYSMHWSVHV